MTSDSSASLCIFATISYDIRTIFEQQRSQFLLYRTILYDIDDVVQYRTISYDIVEIDYSLYDIVENDYTVAQISFDIV